MKSKLYLIIRREYLERVSRKSFIITTILMPIIMVGLMVAPGLLMALSSPEEKTIAVVDQSGLIASALDNDGEVKFESFPADFPIDSLKAMEQYDAVLVIGSDIVDHNNNVQLYTHSSPSMQTESYITHQLSSRIEDIKTKKYEIDNLDQILNAIKADVRISTYRTDQEEEQATSSLVSFLIGISMDMIIYMFLLIYGQMVMTSIIEEKNNRVLEIVVSSVKPKVLMLGKILGIGAVALTQILIWAILIGCVSRWVMPMFANIASSSEDIDLAAAISQLGDTGYILSLFGYITLFLIGGFMLYASIYAAIGSAVDNIQDASQLTTIALAPIIIAMIFSMSVVQDPNSHLAFWLSIIPLTSPMVMMSRIPFGIPAWEIWLSLAILVASFFAMIWLSAKIYRVGIFMYGKKPSIKDLIRWARYK